MSRGAITEAVRVLSKELFGYKIGVRELRLIPYIFQCLLDNINIGCEKVNDEERGIIIKWQDEGRLFTPTSNLRVTSDFYDIMSKILKIGYCSDNVIL